MSKRGLSSFSGDHRIESKKPSKPRTYYLILLEGATAEGIISAYIEEEAFKSQLIDTGILKLEETKSCSMFHFEYGTKRFTDFLGVNFYIVDQTDATNGTCSFTTVEGYLYDAEPPTKKLVDVSVKGFYHFVLSEDYLKSLMSEE